MVFESDDWGKVAGREDGIYPAEFGERTDWSHDRLENEAELETLYALLESFKNDFERQPAFTANFIVSNPDFEKTILDKYRRLHLQSIDENFPQLHKKWIDGISRGVFYPQYHGRLHYNTDRYLYALQNDEKTKFLFDQGINGGMENFSQTKKNLYSEYFRTDLSSSVLDLNSWIESGLKDFERIFRIKSASTIAPNYYIHPSNFENLADCGIQFLQGGNKILYTQNGTEFHCNFCQGTKFNQKLTILARNHKFEPKRNKLEWQADFSIQAAKHWFKIGAPVVIDTHRFNYVSGFAENSLRQLRKFLEAMRSVQDLRILTTPELGQAITNNGLYTDVFSCKEKQLTPKDNFVRKLARKFVS